MNFSESAMNNISVSDAMYSWASDLFPICRSITGQGVRETFKYLKKLLPNLETHEAPSGTQAFDWTVPDEWNIYEAYVMDEQGNKIIDFANHNLHVVGYSIPVNKTVTLPELNEHLYSLEDQPNAIPYVTSYYEKRWGFCITHEQRMKLKPGNFKVYINSKLESGHLVYGELLLLGKEKSEVLLSTNICHPSMANNELSGPVVTTALARWLMDLPDRRYTYRIIFVPETIGSIVYLSRNLEKMKKNTIAGYQITCVGDDRSYSFLPSRQGDTLADRITRHVLKYNVSNYVSYSFLDRGSDERQYCSPGIDLPVVSLMRTKYGSYPEYHTSLDNLDLISAIGLGGAYSILKKCLTILEENYSYVATCLCEPQLGKRGLYSNISLKGSVTENMITLCNFLAYADGKHDLVDIAQIIGVPAEECLPLIKTLLDTKLISRTI
jgi:aminopeptidase-like protein